MKTSCIFKAFTVMRVHRGRDALGDRTANRSRPFLTRDQNAVLLPIQVTRKQFYFYSIWLCAIHKIVPNHSNLACFSLHK